MFDPVSDVEAKTQAIHRIVTEVDKRRGKLALVFVGVSVVLTGAGIAGMVLFKEPLAVLIAGLVV